mgnify:CR=1 FL=1
MIDLYWHKEWPHTFIMINWEDINTKKDFAEMLGIKYRQFTYLMYGKHFCNNYYQFTIPKKNGDDRVISSPNKELKQVQRKLADVLYIRQQSIWKKNHIQNKISHGFQKNKSIYTNAKAHRNKRYVVNFDIENYFDTINFGRVRGFFLKNRNFMLEEEVATTIAQLVCYNGSLPQGAPTSPIISNLICNNMDMR